MSVTLPTLVVGARMSEKDNRGKSPEPLPFSPKEPKYFRISFDLPQAGAYLEETLEILGFYVANGNP